MAYDYQGIVNEVLRAIGEVTLDNTTDFNAASKFHAFVKDSVNDSIADIYAREDNNWEFARATGTQTLLTDGTIQYSLPSDTAWVEWDSFYLNKDLPASGEDAKDLDEIPWETYREGDFMDDLNATSDSYTKPDHVIRLTDNDYIISHPADLAYQVKFEYYKNPTVLSAATDVPDIPERFKSVIKIGALVYVYGFRDNAEEMTRAEDKFDFKINEMRRQLIKQTDSMTVVA